MRLAELSDESLKSLGFNPPNEWSWMTGGGRLYPDRPERPGAEWAWLVDLLSKPSSPQLRLDSLMRKP